jgi:DNA polymerase III subunit beta
MRFSVNREALLKPLQLISGVVERRHTIPILANVLLDCSGGHLTLLGTDIEIEFSGKIELEKIEEPGVTTTSARKLIDICRGLPEGIDIEFHQKTHYLQLKSGSSRFNLSTLPASDFPKSEEKLVQQSFLVNQKRIYKLLVSTSFAMAQQDIRYYLNGILLGLTKHELFCVASDGHRLALGRINVDDIKDEIQIIIPRKTVFELTRLFHDGDGEATFFLCENQLRVKINNYLLTSKLLDASFPDFNRLIPEQNNCVVYVDRDLLKQALALVSTILSQDKNKTVRFELTTDQLRIITRNTDQEEAEQYLEVKYDGSPMNITFNIHYLIDALNSLEPGLIKISLTSSESGARIEQAENSLATHVIMPMRL